MHAFSALLALLLASVVHAGIYVTNPVQPSTCTAGQSCTVQWVDDGVAPTLAAIGECQVGLYNGELNLIQSLPSVDVGTTTSFSFVPSPSNPNGQYYIYFSATGINYQAFSASFAITGGGSSAPGSTPATTPTGSSTSAGSTTPSGTGSTPSGTSTPVTGATTPTGSPTVDTTATTGSPTLTTPSVATTPASTFTTPTTSTTNTASRTSTSASATPSNAAGRVGSSTSLVGLVAALVGVLAF